MKRTLIALTAIALIALAVPTVSAAPPVVKGNPQQFEVYDNTSDGLQAAVDPDIGNVQTVANPGGQERLVIQIHLQGAAPNCTLTVELVRANEASNGGLDETGHTGVIQDLGTVTTNIMGNGNAHFDVAPSGDGNPDTQAWGHIDLEDRDRTCVESDQTGVGFNEYGAAPDPALDTPFTWYQ